MLKDKDIREALFDFLECEYGKIRIFEEKTMGRSRADVVMVTPKDIYGIEIKSDADTYARLDRQVKDYNKFYDFNYVVVGSSHGAHIKEHVPDWWGIITVERMEDELDFYVLRKPDVNPKLDWKKKMGILWRPELVHIQELNSMPKYKEKSKDFVVEKILLKVPEDILRVQMCNELFERDYSLIGETIEKYRKEQADKAAAAGRKVKRRRKKTGKRAVIKAVRKIRTE